MDKKLESDLNLSQSVVNYVLAVYLGKANYLNMLARLGQAPSTSEDLLRTERALERAKRWKEDILAGIPVLSASWKIPETFDGQRALSSLKDIKPDVLTASQNTEKFKKEVLGFQDPGKLKNLIALFAWVVHSRDTYLRGWAEYYEKMGHADTAMQYKELVPSAMSDMNTLDNFVAEASQVNADSIAASTGKINPAFIDRVVAQCDTLPGLFRMYAHDILQLTNTYSGEFTFELAEIEPNDAARWKHQGFNAMQAGYWQAFRVPPERALEWVNEGINDPALAGAWNQAGFAVGEAKLWLPTGLSAPVSARWARAGVAPESAKEQVSRGVIAPK